MKFKLLILVFLVFAIIGVATAQPDDCYSVSFGLEVRPEAQAILDAQGYLVQNIQLEMQRALNRDFEMNGTCLRGELGQIYDTEPRVFAVFQSVLDDYGVLRIMTEEQYYTPPFDENSVGWQFNAEE